MIPKGFLMLLKQLLPAFGIQINPEEVETLFNNIKVWVPELVTYTRVRLDSIESEIGAIRRQNEKILDLLAQRDEGEIGVIRRQNEKILDLLAQRDIDIEDYERLASVFSSLKLANPEKIDVAVATVANEGVYRDVVSGS